MYDDVVHEGWVDALTARCCASFDLTRLNDHIAGTNHDESPIYRRLIKNFETEYKKRKNMADASNLSQGMGRLFNSKSTRAFDSCNDIHVQTMHSTLTRFDRSTIIRIAYCLQTTSQWLFDPSRGADLKGLQIPPLCAKIWSRTAIQQSGLVSSLYNAILPPFFLPPTGASERGFSSWHSATRTDIVVGLFAGIALYSRRRRQGEFKERKDG